MNAERLLAHYEEIAEAPDAVARLRRFILDLAIRGKLVSQRSGDETADQLLKWIGAEKARRVHAGEIRGSKPLPPIAAPFEIPAGWRWSQLAEIGILSPRNEAPDDLRASFVPMPLIAAEYGKPNGHEVRPWGEIKKGYTHFAEGDVGLAKITPCFENGKSTVFRNLAGGIGAGTTELHIVRPLFVNPDYILLFLKSPHFIEHGIPRMTGTAGQKRVPTDYFAHSPFPLPPVEEQDRIVAKVDELMTLCDELEAARAVREAARDRLGTASFTRLNAPTPGTFQSDARFALDALPALTTRPDQIKLLRRTILNLAWRAKLVPQDVSDEPASMLLVKIAAERGDLVSNGHLRRERPLGPIPASQVPFDIPPTWCWARLGDVVLFTQYGTSEKASVSEEGVPVLTMGNIQEGRVTWGKEKRIPKNSPDLPALLLRKFDLLYNRTNSAELVGKTGIYLADDQPRTFASYLIRLRPSLAWTDPRYLNIAMNTPEFRETQIIPLIKKQTGQANVNGTALKNMLVPLPPLAEQRRIVAKLDELMALCGELEASLSTVDATRRRLLEALLAEALAPAAWELEAA